MIILFIKLRPLIFFSKERGLCYKYCEKYKEHAVGLIFNAFQNELANNLTGSFTPTINFILS